MISAVDRTRESASLARPSAARWSSSLRLTRRDLAVVAVVGLALATAVALVPVGPQAIAVRAIGVALALVEAASLLWIRAAPVRGMAVALSAGVAIQALYPFAGSWGGATIALSRLSRVRPPRVSLWGWR